MAGGSNAEEYQAWRDEYEIKEAKEFKSKSVQKPSVLGEVFDTTFKSARKLETLTQQVEMTGRSIDDMRSALVDESFDSDELEYWAEKYLVIENKPEKMLKTTNFESLHLLKRFILYFIHEFYVFEGSNHCYYKRKPTAANNSVIGDYDISNFAKTQINYYDESTIKHKSSKLSDLLITIPFHKFSSTICSWNHDPSDLELFIKANPIQRSVRMICIQCYFTTSSESSASTMLIDTNGCWSIWPAFATIQTTRRKSCWCSIRWKSRLTSPTSEFC
ncbi:unnamed protein product [Phytophthora fragariaefolia]|uniref:Unnamed protein product n=1 Tax=Phytophthora fragariaefolia TaxID=1490495 RepID=A0A9W6YEX0_9STRA|nr:unnamed protein product [Phytophthora fragariaefolia]